MAQFACAVALHAHDLTLRAAADVTARASDGANGDAARVWRVSFRMPTDSSERVVEVDEIQVGAAREYVARVGQQPLNDRDRRGQAGHLLILGCSARKRATPGQLPALERYDGPLYRVVRKALREGRAPHPLHILVISARYGLLRASDPVEFYDQRMTRRQAERLREEIRARLVEELGRASFSQAHISLGADYLAALGGVDVIARAVGHVSVASGGLGERQAQLRDWLHGCCSV